MSEEQLQKGMDFLDNNFHFIESKDSVPTIDWLLSKAKAACMRHGVRGIIIDPYNEIDASRDGNKREDEHIRDLISKCKSFCRKHDVTMWMVAHPSKMQRGSDGSYPPPSMYDVSGSAHWNNMCDVGLVVHRDFDSGETRVITRKIREQGLYGSIGECFFRYNLMKHCYEESNPTPPAYSSASPYSTPRYSGNATSHWTDHD
jgi:twinkle protein